MRFPRCSGVLLHPTSLPGRWGIGDLGDSALAFVDWLAAAGQQLWQVMPLGPTGYGDSPYQALSAFAGNPLLLSPELLLAQGLLAAEDLADAPMFPDERVDYGPVIDYKNTLLQRSFARFRAGASAEQRNECAHFCEQQRAWLEAYALFAALKAHHGGAVWSSWGPELARYEPEALETWRARLADEVALHSYGQWQFFAQWQRVKEYTNARGVRIVGDVPIFVAYDSADVWANQGQFHLDAQGQPTVVAGVPPDYFSATGQRWGNPLYRWEAMAVDGFAWWRWRVRELLANVDVIRLDHFRGFEAYWEVPAEEESAINGRWVQAPGFALLGTLREELGDLPIIAEDLGLITPAVEALRDAYELPGMKVLQFAFGGDADELYLPHNYTNRNCVVYTGTHDNDTTIGWFTTRGEAERQAVQRYLGRDGSDIAWDLLRLALASVADVAIVPLPDILRLGNEARMNVPGAPGGNWSWRFHAGQLDPGLAGGVRSLVETYGRMRDEG